jgi:hypothetical protein
VFGNRTGEVEDKQATFFIKDNLNNTSASPTLLSGEKLFFIVDNLLCKRQCWARAVVVYVVFYIPYSTPCSLTSVPSEG